MGRLFAVLRRVDARNCPPTLPLSRHDDRRVEHRMINPTDPPQASSLPAVYALEPVAALQQLKSTDQGLTSAQAAERLILHGPNELAMTHRTSAWAVLAGQFKNVLLIVLLVAVGLSAAMGHTTEAIAIAVIVAFAVILGFVQEFRAEKAIESLREMAAPLATVLRDGRETRVPARELVPGDVVLLAAGDRVPADCRLIEAINLQAEEAALTGESLPVEKHIQPLAALLPVGDRRNMVHAATAVTYGRGRAVVSATGLQTELGKIAGLLQGVVQNPTPLQVNLDRVGKQLVRAALVVVVAIVALGLWRGQPLTDLLVFAIALAVAVVPEALPAVVTISLAIGVQRLVKRNALVRRLAAAETLGSTSVICSDKTGTLTRDEMTVRAIHIAGDQLAVTGAGYLPQGEFLLDGAKFEPTPQLHTLLQAAVLASDAHFDPAQSGPAELHGDPTEGALLVAAAKAGIDKTALDLQIPRVDEIPFTSESKRMTTYHDGPNGRYACIKGAPEVLVPICARVLGPDGELPLDEGARQGLLEDAKAMASQALRVLAIAQRSDATRDNVNESLTLLGLFGLLDPPRPEAKAAIARCHEAGVRVVMITGDHPVTAEAVARELGLIKGGRVMAGAELAKLSDQQLTDVADEIDVYARVSPADKLRVVEALQRRGAVVAMTGDGVNDAPALKKADIGIAMGITGTDVSKEAAAMTLTDDNFASIVGAVEEGRAIYGNIKKYLMYLLSSNIGEMGLMTVASVLGWPLPLSAVQLLYINLATDGLPALALALDPPEEDLMQRPPRDPKEGIFTRPVVTLMLVGGLWSTLINLGMFQWALSNGHGLQHAMTMTFLSLVLVQFFKAYSFRSDRLSTFNRPFANRWLNIAVAWELGLMMALLHVPALQKVFGLTDLTPLEWTVTVTLAASVIGVLEIAKAMARKGWFGILDHTSDHRRPQNPDAAKA
jgi:Ca2+-transporting ATPase